MAFIPRKIRRARLNHGTRGLTLNQLSAKIGVAYKTLWNWENGACEPPAGQLEKIANALQVDIEYFYEEKPNG